MAHWSARGDSVPPRLELVIPSLEIGGMEVVAVNIARGLQELGWEVGITCTNAVGELAARLDDSGIPVALRPAPGIRSLLKSGPLTAHLRVRQPHVVLTHSGVWLRGARAARKAGVAVVIHAIHGLFVKEPWYGAIEKRIAATLTNRIIAVSPTLSEFLVQRAGVAACRIEVIPNGIDVKRFRRRQDTGALRSSIGATAETLVLGTVARLDPIKNIHLLLHAAQLLGAESINLQVMIVGNGPARAQLEGLSASLGLGDRVHFVGAVPDPERWYGAMDVFVLPSRMEAAPMSLLEAMASGCCVVATEVGANRETLDGGNAGLLVPPDDLQGLYTAIRELALAPQRRASLAMAGFQRVCTKYSLDLMLQRYDHVLRELLPAIGPRHHTTAGRSSDECRR